MSMFAPEQIRALGPTTEQLYVVVSVPFFLLNCCSLSAYMSTAIHDILH